MLDMSLSIRTDCERHNSDGLQVFVDFSDFSLRSTTGDQAGAVEMCHALSETMKVSIKAQA